MLVFIIPAWHPTKNKPNHCRWILPHINMVKSIANVVVLHVDQEADQGSSIEVSESDRHFYLPSPICINRFTRTKFGYSKVVRAYNRDLKVLYTAAIEKYGKPDLIHAHVSMPAGCGAAELGKMYDIPVIVTEHYSGFFSDTKFPWRIRSFYKKMIDSINGFYTVSPGFKNKIEKGRGFKVDGVTANPINTTLFSPVKPRKKDNVLKLVSTGSVGYVKGTDILLAAVQKLPLDLNWQLTIIGNSHADKGKWEGLMHPRVTLLPQQSQEKLAEIYSQSDIYIVSSRVETANVSMLEAMACGCYVITSRISAPETLLDGTVASFFTSEKVEELTEKILATKKVNRELQRDYVVSNFSKDKVSERLKTAYENIINKK